MLACIYLPLSITRHSQLDINQLHDPTNCRGTFPAVESVLRQDTTGLKSVSRSPYLVAASRVPAIVIRRQFLFGLVRPGCRLHFRHRTPRPLSCRPLFVQRVRVALPPNPISKMTWDLNRQRWIRAINSKYIFDRLVRVMLCLSIV